MRITRLCIKPVRLINPLPEVVSMRIEADYSGRGTTRSILKWIAVGMALHVALWALVFMWGRSCCRTFFRYFALLMAAGWTTVETRALISVPLPITKPGLTHSRFSSMRITTANVDADWCPFNTHWPAVNAHRAQCALKRIQCRQASKHTRTMLLQKMVEKEDKNTISCICCTTHFVVTVVPHLLEPLWPTVAKNVRISEMFE